MGNRRESGIRKGMTNNGAKAENEHVSFNSQDERLFAFSLPSSGLKSNWNNLLSDNKDYNKKK
jgi:hypothetical protein